MSLIVPWYVNDTLDGRQRQRFEAHLSQCAVCRDEVRLERRVLQSMAVSPGVEYMPAPSLKRLQARLDALSAAPIAAGASADVLGASADMLGAPAGVLGASADALGAPADMLGASADVLGDPADAPPGSAADVPGAPGNAPAVAAPVRRKVSWQAREVPWRAMMAASVVMIALALGLVTADRRLRAPSAPQNYFTVTSPAPRAPDAVIRAVFAPTITLVELQSLLDESQLRIVAGPTEAGVYSLAANSDRPVAVSLDLLRKHSTVRFAESTSSAAASRPQ